LEKPQLQNFIYIFYGKAVFCIISNPMTSGKGLHYLNSVGASEQLSHLQTGKFNCLSSKEP
jgi:hypothetical protein